MVSCWDSRESARDSVGDRGFAGELTEVRTAPGELRGHLREPRGSLSGVLSRVSGWTSERHSAQCPRLFAHFRLERSSVCQATDSVTSSASAQSACPTSAPSSNCPVCRQGSSFLQMTVTRPGPSVHEGPSRRCVSGLGCGRGQGTCLACAGIQSPEPHACGQLDPCSHCSPNSARAWGQEGALGDAVFSCSPSFL